MRKEHLRLLHCPPEQLLSAVRQRYWPLSGRREARKIVRSCVSCFRFRPTVPELKMGDLPKQRVTGLGRPFRSTGVDYAGPLQLRESRRRGRIHISKGYIAIFTCLSTKAVHIELVSDLTTEAYLAALNRFTARRGICSKIFSDNGTNFVGAARELKEVYTFLERKSSEIEDNLARRRIKWSFIPPHAPHFGGIWEAAVKVAKRRLYTVTKGRVLTFEECSTLLSQIEAIMNSRPLMPLSSDPNDLSALTPAHFLIGDSLIQPAQHDFTEISENRLTHWQNRQRLLQQFWIRFHKEYLNELQPRTKWTASGDNIELNTVVLIKEDHTPPLQWALGRITALHPGQDGVVRVVTVKTQS
ncbi:PREDICTED: uncharacterized protein LOC105555658, partial [Vollenhovia emeryi]|uniref:uncharacterized protein LOC105555658 n=1 Tax=Vollenhovia emeryi TaxID=411798 RepID=UPI0005F46871